MTFTLFQPWFTCAHLLSGIYLPCPLMKSVLLFSWKWRSDIIIVVVVEVFQASDVEGEQAKNCNKRLKKCTVQKSHGILVTEEHGIPFSAHVLSSYGQGTDIVCGPAAPSYQQLTSKSQQHIANSPVEENKFKHMFDKTFHSSTLPFLRSFNKIKRQEI